MSDYTPQELMIAVAAREIADGDLQPGKNLRFLPGTLLPLPGHDVPNVWKTRLIRPGEAGPTHHVFPDE